MKDSENSSNVSKVSGVFFCAMMLVVLSVSVALCKDTFVESGEYKSKDFRKGCITDYTDMEEGGDIKWVWVSPDVKLSEYRVVIKSFSDVSDEVKSTLLAEMKKLFLETFEKNRQATGSLDAEVCIYEVQKFSAGKAWIPFAGGHKMQAGVGAEMILRTKDKKIVAKFRHFAREGAQIEQAAEEVADDLKKYMSKH